MSDEPTKACVMVLRFENKMKYVLLYPVMKFFKYLSKFIDWFVQFINWCIVRAIVRWVGLIALAWIIYVMCNAINTKPTYINGALDGTPVAITMMCCFALVIVGWIVLHCWIGIPRKEKAILTEYYTWFEEK